MTDTGHLRIITSPGDCVWGTNDDIDWVVRSPKETQRVRELLTNGLLLYLDSRRKLVLCPLKLSLNMERQCLAEFQGGDDELIAAFVESVEQFEAETSGSVNRSDDGIGAVYWRLRSDTSAKPEIELGELDEMGLPVKIGTPSTVQAVDIAFHLMSRFDRILVCTAGRVEALPPADIVIVPNTTDQIGIVIGPVEESDQPEDRETTDTARSSHRDAGDNSSAISRVYRAVRERIIGGSDNKTH